MTTPLQNFARSLYASPPRAYHNWEHVESCLAELDRVRPLCEQAALVEIALWFHDAVYDPRAKDNEARSADAAAPAMQQAGYAEDAIATVRQLILDTGHAQPPATNDGRLIADIDLAVLGQPPDVFAAYERAIRQEYAHVPHADFARGRAAVLRRFLDRPAVYHTPFFRRRYEAAARENLGRSLRSLTA